MRTIGCLPISGELLERFLSSVRLLPEDVVILKIIPSLGGAYSFDVIMATEKGFKVAEDANYTKKDRGS